MDFSGLINCMGALLIMMLVGVICCRIGWLDKEKNKNLSKIVIYVGQPALLFNGILGVDAQVSLPTMGRVLIATALMYLVLWAIGKIFGWTVNQQGKGNLYHFMVMFGNVGFVGYPVITALLGEDKMFYGALVNVFFPVLLYSYGVILMVGKNSDVKISWKLFLNPSIIATAVAFPLYLLNVKLPAAVLSAASYMGDMSVAGAMFVLGATLATIPAREVLRDWRALALAAVSLVLSPIAVWAVLRLIISDPVILAVAVVLSAVPVGSNGTAMCLEYGADENVTTRGFFITTVLSIVTIPMVMLLLF